MIAGSLLFILAAILLLVLGLAQGSNPYLVGSIAASMLAAIALVVAGRGADADEPAAALTDADDPMGIPHFDDLGGVPLGDRAAASGPVNLARVDVAAAPRTPESPRDRAREVHAGGSQAQGDRADDVAPAEVRRPAADVVIPSQTATVRRRDDDADPAGEPGAQVIAPAEASALRELTANVHVVDGRPRFHLETCPFLHDRDSEPLPVHEAVELGFTPCADCRAATRLLRDAERSGAAGRSHDDP